ncbi:MAG: crossover junction endodeoxyribonuclease RuvC [Ruminococcus sp.]|nr:crossover junction endodeoxyribonuclease RuvC [Ruminococcus sp.]
MVILGIDPGYAIVGWGVIEYNANRFRPIAFGAITTEAHTEFDDRLMRIYDDVVEVIKRSRPDAMSIEKLYFNTNITTGIQVAHARGVIVLAARQAGIPVYEYTPLQVKTAVTGYGKARKPQVMEMTRRLLHLKEVPKPDDTADALAIAITHTQAAGTDLRRMLMKKRGNDS